MIMEKDYLLFHQKIYFCGLDRKKMKRTHSLKENLTNVHYHAKYLRELEELPFKLEIDLESLPNEPDFESPK
jgi:hypothetical protein